MHAEVGKKPHFGFSSTQMVHILVASLPAGQLPASAPVTSCAASSAPTLSDLPAQLNAGPASSASSSACTGCQYAHLVLHARDLERLCDRVQARLAGRAAADAAETEQQHIQVSAVYGVHDR